MKALRYTLLFVYIPAIIIFYKVTSSIADCIRPESVDPDIELIEDLPIYEDASTVILLCDTSQNYVGYGPVAIYCSDDTWIPDPSSRECKEPCEVPDLHEDIVFDFSNEPLENVSYQDSTTFSLSCGEEGYVIDGPTQLVCDDGAWVPEGEPICIELQTTSTADVTETLRHTTPIDETASTTQQTQSTDDHSETPLVSPVSTSAFTTSTYTVEPHDTTAPPQTISQTSVSEMTTHISASQATTILIVETTEVLTTPEVEITATEESTISEVTMTNTEEEVTTHNIEPTVENSTPLTSFPQTPSRTNTVEIGTPEATDVVSRSDSTSQTTLVTMTGPSESSDVTTLNAPTESDTNTLTTEFLATSLSDPESLSTTLDPISILETSQTTQGPTKDSISATTVQITTYQEQINLSTDGPSSIPTDFMTTSSEKPFTENALTSLITATESTTDVRNDVLTTAGEKTVETTDMFSSTVTEITMTNTYEEVTTNTIEPTIENSTPLTSFPQTPSRTNTANIGTSESIDVVSRSDSTSQTTLVSMAGPSESSDVITSNAPTESDTNTRTTEFLATSLYDTEALSTTLDPISISETSQTTQGSTKNSISATSATTHVTQFHATIEETESSMTRTSQLGNEAKSQTSTELVPLTTVYSDETTGNDLLTTLGRLVAYTSEVYSTDHPTDEHFTTDSANTMTRSDDPTTSEITETTEGVLITSSTFTSTSRMDSNTLTTSQDTQTAEELSTSAFSHPSTAAPTEEGHFTSVTDSLFSIHETLSAVSDKVTESDLVTFRSATTPDSFEQMTHMPEDRTVSMKVTSTEASQETSFMITDLKTISNEGYSTATQPTEGSTDVGTTTETMNSTTTVDRLTEKRTTQIKTTAWKTTENVLETEDGIYSPSVMITTDERTTEAITSRTTSGLTTSGITPTADDISSTTEKDRTTQDKTSAMIFSRTTAEQVNTYQSTTEGGTTSADWTTAEYITTESPTLPTTTMTSGYTSTMKDTTGDVTSTLHPLTSTKDMPSASMLTYAETSNPTSRNTVQTTTYQEKSSLSTDGLSSNPTDLMTTLSEKQLTESALTSRIMATESTNDVTNVVLTTAGEKTGMTTETFSSTFKGSTPRITDSTFSSQETIATHTDTDAVTPATAQATEGNPTTQIHTQEPCQSCNPETETCLDGQCKCRPSKYRVFFNEECSETNSFTLTFRILLIEKGQAIFSNDLLDKQSSAYQILQGDLVNSINSIFVDLLSFLGSEIVSFQTGSIIATSLVYLESNSPVTTDILTNHIDDVLITDEYTISSNSSYTLDASNIFIQPTNECSLGIDDCSPFATCSDFDKEGFNCTCIEGYTSLSNPPGLHCGIVTTTSTTEEVFTSTLNANGNSPSIATWILITVSVGGGAFIIFLLVSLICVIRKSSRRKITHPEETLVVPKAKKDNKLEAYRGYYTSFNESIDESTDTVEDTTL